MHPKQIMNSSLARQLGRFESDECKHFSSQDLTCKQAIQELTTNIAHK